MNSIPTVSFPLPTPLNLLLPLLNLVSPSSPSNAHSFLFLLIPTRHKIFEIPLHSYLLMRLMKKFSSLYIYLCNKIPRNYFSLFCFWEASKNNLYLHLILDLNFNSDFFSVLRGFITLWSEYDCSQNWKDSDLVNRVIVLCLLIFFSILDSQ